MIKNAVCQTYFQMDKLCSTHGKLTTTTFQKNNHFIVNGSVSMWTPGTTKTGNMQPYENKLTKCHNSSLKFKIMIHRSRRTCTPLHVKFFLLPLLPHSLLHLYFSRSF